MFAIPGTSGSDATPASDVLGARLAQLGSPMLYVRNTEIFGEGDFCDSVLRVVNGAVRTCKLLADGRRHISAFYMAGDVFGLETSNVLGVSVETTCNSTIAAVERSALFSQTLQDADLARALWQATAEELRRTRRHMMLLVQSAEERVASFLLEMAGRQESPAQIDLPMSRQDIADYLGLTIETISRSITHLEDRSIIELCGTRRVKLRSLPELRRLGA